jgi:hypothetical protein
MGKWLAVTVGLSLLLGGCGHDTATPARKPHHHPSSRLGPSQPIRHDTQYAILHVSKELAARLVADGFAPDANCLQLQFAVKAQPILVVGHGKCPAQGAVKAEGPTWKVRGVSRHGVTPPLTLRQYQEILDGEKPIGRFRAGVIKHADGARTSAYLLEEFCTGREYPCRLQTNGGRLTGIRH